MPGFLNGRNQLYAHGSPVRALPLAPTFCIVHFANGALPHIGHAHTSSSIGADGRTGPERNGIATLVSVISRAVVGVHSGVCGKAFTHPLARLLGQSS
eukprot:3700836-Prymnesium_polylepis.1